MKGGPIMALFESRKQKAAKRQVAIRLAKKKIQKYVNGCRSMAEEYLAMARNALLVNDEEGCGQYLATRILYQRQADKWTAFLLRMKDLSMRGEMAGAMEGLLDGMRALTREIQANITLKSMGKIVHDLNLASARLGQTEDQLSVLMEGLDFEVTGAQETPGAEKLPEELQAEVQKQRAQLLQDLAGQERARRQPVTTNAGGRLDVDTRIASGRERLRSLRQR
jgi:hypothetical protein